jgi:SAM-dependent methyltransferase
MDLREVPRHPFRRHPWEVARARFFRDTLRREGLLAEPGAVLDVGAGDGYLAAKLLESMPRGSSVVCFDPHYGGDDIARFSASLGTGTAALSFSASRPHRRFELVLLLDVIEHVEDDRGFLDQIVSENLAPGAAVLVSVPAWPLLFTQHDVELKHFRRYAPRVCRQLLLDQGHLAIVRCGGLFHGPLLPRTSRALRESAARRIGCAVPPSAHLGGWRAGAIVSGAIDGLLLADNFLSHQSARLGWSLPGLSFWALCRKESP